MVKNALKSDLKTYAIALFFGALLPVAFAPTNWWVATFVCIPVLFVLLREATVTACFWRAFTFGIGMFATGVSWVYVSIHVHGNTHAVVALLLTALFVLVLSFVFALPFALLGLKHSKHPLNLLVGFPCIWVISEIFRGWVFTGFPWLYIGNAFIDTWFSGWAALIGVNGISWIVVFAAAFLANINLWKKFTSPMELSLLTIILLLAGGLYFGQKSWTSPTAKQLKVGLVQPALPLEQKWNKSELLKIIQLYKQLHEPLLSNDLVVWPESAIPALRKNIKPLLEELNLQAHETKTGLIMGLPTTGYLKDTYYNSVIGLGLSSGQYDKQHLVPFGEYVPLASALRGLIGFFDLPMSSFSAGEQGQPLIYFSGYQVGVAICYEIAYPRLVREIASEADFLVTTSNDAWFGGTIGPHQHLEIARMRALENGKPLLRATNDGLSAIIDQKGRIKATMPQFEQGVLEGAITPHSGRTPFNHFGNKPILFALLLTILASTFYNYQPKKVSQRR